MSPDGPAATLPPASVAFVLGTRPEIIKLGILIRMLGESAVVIHTGQHYDAELSKVFFANFGVPTPATTLGVGGSTRGAQIGEAVTALSASFASAAPAVVVVQGDTNSAAAGAIAANAAGIPLVHVEAGLRSFDRRMPEEHNRIIVDHLADVCCAPTAGNAANLAAEGIAQERITITGNPIVEAVAELLPEPASRRALCDQHMVIPGGFILSTFHRPENVDEPHTLTTIMAALEACPLPVLLPLHPRTAARLTASKATTGSNVRITTPLDYAAFLALAAESALIVSDSGGIQEESSILKRPVIVVRRSTERPEVVGTFADLMEPGMPVADRAAEIVADLPTLLPRLAALPTPFGDGEASRRIATLIATLA